MLNNDFFDRDAVSVAKDLLGKVLRVKHENIWLQARIIETEAYELDDKASHASLGYTEKRKALFMPAGTIYMYYSRGADSMNVSCQGDGCAVLIKSGYPHPVDDDAMIKTMQAMNPQKNKPEPRPINRLCAGQTLLCKSLGITVKAWDQQAFDLDRFCIADEGLEVKNIIAATRLGIPEGRDEHLEYRFVDSEFVKYCTKKPVEPRFLG